MLGKYFMMLFLYINFHPYLIFRWELLYPMLGLYFVLYGFYFILYGLYFILYELYSVLDLCHPSQVA